MFSLKKTYNILSIKDKHLFVRPLVFCSVLFVLVWGRCEIFRCLPWLLILTVRLPPGCLAPSIWNAWPCMCFLLCCGLCCVIFLLSDSGGCARKRAAMSVTITSVKRVQSSPNLLAAGIISLTHIKWLNLTFLSFQSYLLGMMKAAVNTFLMADQFLFFLSQEQLLFPSVFVLKIKSQRNLISYFF